MVIIAPAFSPFEFDEIDWDLISTPPNWENRHIFGTDAIGRDLFVRTLYGGRMSLMIGVIATLVSLFIGITYGATAGYLGGKTDAIMMRIVDILYAMPFMFFVILLMVFFGRNIYLIFIAIGAINVFCDSSDGLFRPQYLFNFHCHRCDQLARYGAYRARSDIES
jgi:oligopeptide transport system permease protein